MASLAEAFAIAVEHHQAGRLQAAAELYRRILAAVPDHAGSLHYMGLAAYQAGWLQDAARWIGKALEVTPDDPEAHSNLGTVYKDLGDTGQATHHYRRALALRPNFHDAHFNLAIVLNAQGDLDQAEEHYRAALAAKPQSVVAANNLGALYRKRGYGDQARRLFETALTVEPDALDAHMNLAALLVNQGQTDPAERHYRYALTLAPDCREALLNLGILCQKGGRTDQAIGFYSRLVDLEPDHVQGRLLLGLLLADAKKKPESALPHLRKSVELDITSPKAWFGLGSALLKLQRYDEAKVCLERALALKPDYVEAHHHLGLTLIGLCRYRETFATYRRALALDRYQMSAHHSLIFSLDFDPAVSERERQEERRRWYDTFGAPHASAIRPHTNTPDPDRRLRIGYVSADFKLHSLMSAVEPILTSHDHQAFEIVCYSGVSEEDPMTARCWLLADRWCKAFQLNDDQLAEQIRIDQIDILVDLSGHTAGNRLPVFARRPAPVQVTAWGHATGTGMPTIDYFLADPVLVPAEQRHWYAETIIDLPVFMCYRPEQNLPTPGPLPLGEGRPPSFGCFTRMSRLNPEVARTCAEILTACPESRLVLKDGVLDTADGRRRILELVTSCGVPEDRLTLLGRTDTLPHMAAFADIDLALDPFPSSAGISTCDALWMGVPIVTLAGNETASRTSAALVTALGLGDWVVKTPEAYVDRVLRAVADPAGLAALRAGLRARFAASPLGDTVAYTRAVERAYREMWRRWCAGHRNPADPK